MKINVTAEDMDYFSVGYKVGKWLFEDINKDNFEVGISSSRMTIPPELLTLVKSTEKIPTISSSLLESQEERLLVRLFLPQVMSLLSQQIHISSRP